MSSYEFRKISTEFLEFSKEFLIILKNFLRIPIKFVGFSRNPFAQHSTFRLSGNFPEHFQDPTVDGNKFASEGGHFYGKSRVDTFKGITEI